MNYSRFEASSRKRSASEVLTRPRRTMQKINYRNSNNNNNNNNKSNKKREEMIFFKKKSNKKKGLLMSVSQDEFLLFKTHQFNSLVN